MACLSLQTFTCIKIIIILISTHGIYLVSVQVAVTGIKVVEASTVVSKDFEVLKLFDKGTVLLGNKYMHTKDKLSFVHVMVLY